MAGCQLLIVGDLVANRFDRGLKPGDLDFNRIDADVSLGNPKIFSAEHHCGPTGDSGRDRDSAFDQHRVSSVSWRL
jgi:hypothetical protein